MGWSGWGGRCRGCGWYKGKGGSGKKGSGKGGGRVLIEMKCETRESQLINLQLMKSWNLVVEKAESVSCNKFSSFNYCGVK